MYLNTVWEYDMSMLAWIPIVSFSIIVLLASIGVIPISYIYVTEIMPEKVRNFVSQSIKREFKRNIYLSFEVLE